MLRHKEEQVIGLIEKFRCGNDEAFDEIVRLIASDIVNIAYCYMKSLEDAKDTCQDVLLKLYRRLKSFRGASRISTWIYRVTINTCIDSLRKKKTTVSLDEAITKDEKSDILVTERVERKDNQIIIRKALEMLSLRQKNVIILKHFEGLKIHQISEILGCSQSSIKTHLVRALDNLRKELGGIK
ncbi:MAG: sigma-70 family RNA polymerase sigma factor [Omnitrophica bacterium]|nr:sigma-70 family RNA polymerase sigma factor [Candidatus Omnitrophota bacterium]